MILLNLFITLGSNTGIGLHAAAGLSWKNPGKIIIGCRSTTETKNVINNLKKANQFNPNTQVEVKELDLLSLNNVSVCVFICAYVRDSYIKV